jgi:nucleotide-binding universal stress UspA family protein
MEKMMKPYKKILVPSDFSEHAERALSTAIDLSSRYDAALTLVHVFDRVVYPMLGSGAVALNLQIAQLEDELKASLEKQRQSAIERGAKSVDARMLHGDPATAIVERARSGSFDLIVMGTHGRRGVTHFLIGSVAERVVRTAPCGVLTVRMQPAGV